MDITFDFVLEALNVVVLLVLVAWLILKATPKE